MEKTRETRMRRLAERQGLRLQKSQRKDASAHDFGTYQLVDAAEGWIVLSAPGGYGMSLDDIELRLEKDAVCMFQVTVVMVPRAFPLVTADQRRRFTTAMSELFSSKFVQPAEVEWDEDGGAHVTIACSGEDASSAGDKAVEIIERNASLVAHIIVQHMYVEKPPSRLYGWL
jgi:hypothetical protein